MVMEFLYFITKITIFRRTLKFLPNKLIEKDLMKIVEILFFNTIWWIAIFFRKTTVFRWISKFTNKKFWLYVSSHCQPAKRAYPLYLWPRSKVWMRARGANIQTAATKDTNIGDRLSLRASVLEASLLPAATQNFSLFLWKTLEFSSIIIICSL